MGKKSRDYLQWLVNRGGNKVKVQAITVDRYGRTVAQLWNNYGLIQSQMAITGMAYGYEQYNRPLAKVPNKGNSEVIERKN